MISSHGMVIRWGRGVSILLKIYQGQFSFMSHLGPSCLEEAQAAGDDTWPLFIGGDTGHGETYIRDHSGMS